MSDEQTIYIGPEDDLTNVRERLEGIPSRHVTLVIPTQTQLRSHVAWKLLHARARELGKDVLIISSDPQIRSVAQAVKFKVAHSLESSPVSRPRSSSRPARTSPPSRGRTQGLSQGRGAQGRGQTSRGQAAEPRILRGARPHETLSRPPEQPEQWSPISEKGTAQPEKESTPSRIEDAITGGLDASFSPFDAPEKPYGQSYEYRIDTTPPPPIRPLSPEHVEEEPDLLLEDFTQAQHIRQAAQGGNEGARKQLSGDDVPPASKPFPLPQSYRATPLPRISDDPFASMDDLQPPPGGEQRGSVSIEGTDTNRHAIQDISEYPTSVIDGEIEDMGDQGAFDLFADTHPSHGAEDELSTYERLSRHTGGMGKTPPASRQDFESEDALPPVKEHPVPAAPPPRQEPPRQEPRRPAAPARTPATSNRPSQQLAGGRQRPGLSRPSQRPGRQRPAAIAATPVGASRAERATATARQQGIGGYIFVASIILFLLLVGALAYFGPSTSVIITLPSRDYSHAVKLTALPKGQQGAAEVAQGTVPADVLSKDFTKSGTGSATGTKKVDNQFASGSAIFTNTGSSPVTIPSGIVVATAGANGKQFVTMANAVVLPSSGNNAIGNSTEVPIQAQKAGVGSNVDKATITVIPDDSLSQIAKANQPLAATDLKLKVTNSAATNGGGAGNATVVTRKDLDTTTKTLQGALNGDIDAWVKQQSSTQDIVGKPTITSALVKPPAEGQIESNGSFPAQLTATVTLMIVRNASLQNATVKQLNTYISKDKAYTNYSVNADTKQPVQVRSMKLGGQGTALTLNFTAAAKALPNNITSDVVLRLIVGRSIPDATAQLKKLQNVQDVSIQSSPGFVSWVAFWSHNVRMELVPGTTPATPKK